METQVLPKLVVGRKKLKLHMLAMDYPESIIKTFVFQKQDTKQSTFVDSEVSLQSTLIDISSLLLLHCPPSQFRVCIYDPENNKFVSLQGIKAQNGLIPSYFLEPSIILIRFQKTEEKVIDQTQQSSLELDSKAKRDIRSKERTIREALAIVKRWRQLTQTVNKSKKSNKRMNLQEAAREIGISKKSLDDYYCQLRLAELHNFNFIQNLDEKMGKLRNFVKERRTNEAVRIRHLKHPKELKVIQKFIVDKKMQEYILQEKQLGESKKTTDEYSFVHLDFQYPFLNEFSSQKVFQNLEDYYYKGFEWLLDEPSDPFIFGSRLCQKKRLQDKCELNLFF